MRSILPLAVAVVLLAWVLAALGDDDLDQGKKVFTDKCLRCHGARADGKGPGAKILKNKPRDLTAGIFKFRTTLADGMPSDADLMRTVRDGLPAYGMPTFGDLSDEDIHDAIAYIKTLVAKGLVERLKEAAAKEGTPFDEAEAQQTAAERLKPGTPVVIPPEPGGADAEAASRGEKLFNDPKRYLCATCHGPKGEGNGPQADTLKDTWGNPIRPRDLTKQKLFRKSGWRPEDTVCRIITGIPGTPMPANPQSVTTPEGVREVWDIARFVESIAAK